MIIYVANAHVIDGIKTYFILPLGTVLPFPKGNIMIPSGMAP